MYAQKAKTQIINKKNYNNLPPGWIKLSKNNTYISTINNNNITEDYYTSYEEFNNNVNKHISVIVKRFISYKKEELTLDNPGYSEEEINSILENYINLDDDGYDYYPCDEDFDSENDNSDSDLSDGDIY